MSIPETTADPSGTIGLVPIPEMGGEVSAWRLMRDQARVLVQSGMLPAGVKTPEAAIAIMQTGREFGLKPMQSFRLIHIISGKPTLSAQFMASLVQQHCAKHGGYLRQTKLTESGCEIEYQRGEWPAPQTFSFTQEDAKRAGLWGQGTWAKYPREMLYNRAVANACRMGWPELVAGVYDPDELGETAYQWAQENEGAPSVDVQAQAATDRESASARYFVVAKEKGISDDERHALQRIAFGVESANDMTADQLRQLTKKFEERTIEELRAAIKRQAELDAVPADDDGSPIPEFLRAIVAANTEAELKAISRNLHEGGVWSPEISQAITQKRIDLGLPAPNLRTANDIEESVE